MGHRERVGHRESVGHRERVGYRERVGQLSGFITAVPAWEGNLACPITGSTCALIYITLVKWATLVTQMGPSLHVGAEWNLLVCMCADQLMNM